jgi:beta-glucosidase
MSVWDLFSHTPGKTANGDTGDTADDSYHQWTADVELLQQLGVNAYRFSLSWSRIMPSGTGQVNAAGLEYYDQLIDALLEANITPLVTLFHWDTPLTLEDGVGGWLSAEMETCEVAGSLVTAITHHHNTTALLLLSCSVFTCSPLA